MGVKRILFTIFMLGMAPWYLSKAWLMSTIGVVMIVCSAIKKEWS